MVEICEKLALFEETFSPGRPMNVRAKELNGNPLLYFSIHPFGQIHRTHSARAKNANSPVRPAIDFRASL